MAGSHLSGKNILLVAYGGGHMRMLVPVARALNAQGAKVTLLPLTAGLTDAKSSGLPVQTLAALSKRWAERDHLVLLGRSIAEHSAHPTIPDVETHIYHGIGLADLIADLGEEPAREMFRRKGRAAFLPTRTWTRLLHQIRPDLVISTSVRRHEGAALTAAQALGIPSICVVDHFPAFDLEYLSQPGHGTLISVLGQAVADLMTTLGRPASEIRIAGNPAFDSLADPDFVQQGQALRTSLGWQDRRVILWPQEGGVARIGGDRQVRPEVIAAALESLMVDDPRLALILRPHPNNPAPVWSAGASSVLIAPDPPVETLLHACDVVVQQTTTVGVQAALLGKHVITIANQGMPPLAEFDLARDIPDLSQLRCAIAEDFKPDLRRLGAPPPGCAAASIAGLAAELLA